MGEVYRARDTRLGREVAFKVLGEGVEQDPDSIARFQREARLAGALNHPNVLTVYDVGEHDRKPFLVSELLEGETLRELLDAGPLSRKMAMRFALQLSQGLSAAHSQGIVHRDLKPENVFVTRDGRAKILDFGIAKLTSSREGEFAETPHTATGQLIGTLAYMSPERLQGGRLDARSDLFSFGCVLYEMFSGRRPFAGKTAVETGAAILHDEPMPLDPVVPPLVADLVARCLRKRVEERFASAQEVADALEQLLATEQTPHPRSERVPHPAQLAHETSALPGRPGADTRVRALAEVLGRAVGERTAREAMRSEPTPADPTAAVQPSAPAPASRWPRTRVAIIAALAVAAVLALLTGVAWLAWRDQRYRQARSQLDEAVRLADAGKLAEAFALALEVDKVIPAEPALTRLWPEVSRLIDVETNPGGAVVQARLYGADDSSWRTLGVTPVSGARIPVLPSQVRLTKPGYVTAERGQWRYNPYRVKLAADLYREGDVPPGMVAVPGGDMPWLPLVGLENVAPGDVPEAFVDKYEVTNGEYRKFIEGGGYRKRDYWKEPFVEGGRTLSWDEAMQRFRDRTGRPGPATWQSGDYPEGQPDHPVTGVSWYEAAAYAVWAGKSLPTIYHWARAATTWATPEIVPRSNFGGTGLMLVGSSGGVSGYGLYDMAGNAKEWCWNSDGDHRYILGGAFNEPIYMFNDADAQKPFAREATFGFRLARYPKPVRQELLAPLQHETRDYSKEHPVDEAAFRIYAGLYGYDKAALDSRVESVTDADRWRIERVGFATAYRGERMSALVYTPKNVPPPWQVVVYFPGSGALHARSSAEVGTAVFSHVVKSGRALVYPSTRAPTSAATAWPPTTRTTPGTTATMC
jgi:formylglycine-generating enzyme required for sulfatase activity